MQDSVPLDAVDEVEVDDEEATPASGSAPAPLLLPEVLPEEQPPKLPPELPPQQAPAEDEEKRLPVPEGMAVASMPSCSYGAAVPAFENGSEPVDTPQSRRRTACKSCNERKLRCSKAAGGDTPHDQPCTSCVERGIRCEVRPPTKRGRKRTMVELLSSGYYGHPAMPGYPPMLYAPPPGYMPYPHPAWAMQPHMALAGAGAAAVVPPPLDAYISAYGGYPDMAHGAAAAAAAAAGALPPRVPAPGCNGHLGGAGGFGGGLSAPAYLPTPAGCPPTSAVQNSPYARYVCAGGGATSAPFLPGGGQAIGSGIASLPTSGPTELAAQAASVSAAE